MTMKSIEMHWRTDDEVRIDAYVGVSKEAIVSQLQEDEEIKKTMMMKRSY